MNREVSFFVDPEVEKDFGQKYHELKEKVIHGTNFLSLQTEISSKLASRQITLREANVLKSFLRQQSYTYLERECKQGKEGDWENLHALIMQHRNHGILTPNQSDVLHEIILHTMTESRSRTVRS